jgi:HPt (histidine-containing phosphotransfer) domain-containing protein
MTVEKGKRFPLSLRTTKELHDKIAGEAKKSGRSLAQEVEHRLENSFVLQERMRDQSLIRELYEQRIQSSSASIEELKEKLAQQRAVLSEVFNSSGQDWKQLVRAARLLGIERIEAVAQQREQKHDEGEKS